MKLIVIISLLSYLLFAQNNNIVGNNINTNGGNVNFHQSNSITNEQINIDRKIDNELLNLMSSNHDIRMKNQISSLLSNSKEVNKLNLPIKEKNRQCRFKAEVMAKILKYVNLKLSFSYCDKIF